MRAQTSVWLMPEHLSQPASWPLYCVHLCLLPLLGERFTVSCSARMCGACLDLCWLGCQGHTRLSLPLAL